ncbi:MAG: hypothetical protein Q9177_002694 [Variospora cf. flavescens]
MDMTPDGQPPDFPSAGATCETCKRPDLSNMTWHDGVKNFFSTYHAAPRMWPIGYIMGSPYSPFKLERAMPSHNWRDAFEDLLAIESGGTMIGEESRKIENQLSAHYHFESSSYLISLCNSNLQHYHRLTQKYSDFRQAALQSKDHQAADSISRNVLARLKTTRDVFVAAAQSARAEHELHKDSSASQRRDRGEWMASLITSGAVPYWKWQAMSCSAGLLMSFYKTGVSPEMDAGISTTELELQDTIEKGKPFGFGSPVPLPRSAIHMLLDGTAYADLRLPSSLSETLTKSKSSIVVQSGGTEMVTLPDGSTGPRVTIKNLHADGSRTTKEFVQKPRELFEEVASTRLITSLMQNQIVTKLQDTPSALSELMEAMDEVRSRFGEEQSAQSLDI